MSLAVAAAALALATPFGELPFRQLNGMASCVQSTGMPGELVRQTDRSLQVLRIGPTGLVPGAVLSGTDPEECAAVASAPGGAGVIAFAHLEEKGGTSINGYLREPGGQSWSPSALGLATPDTDQVSLAAAASERGDALVAATMTTADGTLVRVTRRAPGGGFGAPATLSTLGAPDFQGPSVRAGLSSTGDAIVAWGVESLDRDGPLDLYAAAAPAGGPFGAPQRIGTLDPVSRFDLAVGTDGRALLTFPSGNRVVVVERALGGTWGAPVPLVESAGLTTALPTVAVGPGGAAVVAWTDGVDGSVHARLRAAPGTFGPAVELGPGIGGVPKLRPLLDLLRELANLAGGSGAGSPADVSDPPRATFAGDGRALVTWVGSAQRDGVWWRAPHAALVGETTTVLGAELRDVFETAAPMQAAGGVPAVAWGDDDQGSSDGRIHVAVAGAPDLADPPPPRVSFGTPRPSDDGESGWLVLPVICSAACDVRVHIAGNVERQRMLSLPRAGRGQILLVPKLEPIAPRRAAPVRVLVRYGAPGARRATARTLSWTLPRPPAKPSPRVRGLSARRTGTTVVVRWRTVAPTDTEPFTVLSRNRDGVAIGWEHVRSGPPRRSFRLRIADRRRKVERVTVYTMRDALSSLRKVSVRVR